MRTPLQFSDARRIGLTVSFPTPLKVLIPMLCLLMSPWATDLVYAQGHVVTGTVTSAEDAETMPGVNVSIKGTTVGTATDTDGQYRLEAPSPSDTLVFSFVGFQTMEVPIAGRSEIDVAMQVAELGLEEVVVVGYGTQRRATLTGSVSSISGEDLDMIPTTNLSQSLQGTIPGLIGVTSSGRPGRDNASLLIRGVSTLNDNSPLVVIDGVPERQGGLARLNPADIESISVLKDASAAIYGSRAANGVILVTTKKGLPGETRMTFNVERGWARPAIMPEMADAATYMQMLNEIDVSRGNPARYTAEQIECHRTEADPWECPNTNWYEEGLNDAAQEIIAYASVSGGSETVRYRLSAEGITEEGILVNNADGYDQFGFRSNIDGDLSDHVTLTLNLHGRYENRELPAWNRGINAAWELLQRGKPIEPAFWPNGLPGPDQENGVNPVVSDATGYDDEQNYFFQSNATLALEIPGVEGWTVDGTVAYDRMFWNRKRWQKPWTLYHWDGSRDENNEPILTGVQSGVSDARLDQATANESDVLLRATTQYEHTFGTSHYTKFLLGSEWQKGNWFDLYAFRRFFPTDAIDYLFAGGTTQQNIDGRASHDARLNFFGRFNYNFQEKYLLELIARYDGSYIFPEEGRFGFFPSISAGWRLEQEDWFNDLAGSFVDALKLRASLGQTGNDRIPAYQYLATFGFNGQYAFGDGLGTRISPTRVPNPSITWEVATQFDLGLEGTLLNDRLAFDLTYFRQDRDDILWLRNEAVPQTAGFSLPRENIASVNSRGIEALVAYTQQLAQNVRFQVGGNITFATNEVEYFAEADGVLPHQQNTGRQWGTGLYYVADGIFNTQEELDSYPHWAGARPGDIKFVDYNNDGKIDGADRVRVEEDGIPDVIGSLFTGASIGRFDLYLLLQGAGQARQYVQAGSVGEFGNFFKEDAEKRWTPENPNAEGPRAWNRTDPYWASNANTYFLRDAKYLRLKAASIGYSLPQRWLQNVGGAESLQVYVTGRNLITWSPLKIIDPELRNAAGHEYPMERAFVVGIQMGF